MKAAGKLPPMSTLCYDDRIAADSTEIRVWLGQG